jgi:hypothetical protein
MNDQGQVLLPGLVWFLGLLALFFGMAAWGRGALRQERMETAAAAAAISSARAIASLLNDCATQNLEANGFINLRYKGAGAMQAAMLEEFEEWLEIRQGENTLGDFQSVLNGFKGQATAVGSQVAKLNGATKVKSRSSLSLRVQIHDLDVFIFEGLIPCPIPIDFANVYYKRLWGYDRREAQPPHTSVWSVSDGHVQATAAARVYLDVTPEAPFQNGGFPREQGEEALGDIEIQSFYPQFNAKLVPAPVLNRIIDWVTG